MERKIAVELALDVKAELAEGPVWDSENGMLVWVDLVAGRVHRFDPRSGNDTLQDFGQPVGAAGLREGGGLVLALMDRFALVDESGGVAEVPQFVVDRSHVRFNDGKVDPWGGFWAGTLHWEEQEPVGSLYRLSPDYSVRELLSGITVSNGLDWSRDGSVFYHVDTPTHRVTQFSVETESVRLAGRRAAIEVEPPGVPDGLTLDGEGCVWVALWGGWQVRRYDPSGRLLAVVELPVAHVSSVAFGGARMDELYITTARFGRRQRQLLEEPHAGSIFRCEPGVQGVPPFRFRA